MNKLSITKYYLENYQLSELYQLYDKSNETQAKHEKYLFWSFICKCFPKLNLTSGNWMINTQNVLAPYVYYKDNK